MSSDTPITVYYNSACPVCDAGIDGIRNGMGQCNVEWVDVHRDPERVEQIGKDVEQVRERLHLRSADGRLLVGSAAIAALLDSAPRLGWAGRLIRRLDFLTGPFYNMLAKLLYRWNRRRGHW